MRIAAGSASRSLRPRPSRSPAALRNRASFAAAVAAADKRTHGLDGKQRLDAAIECPLLTEQKCSVYPSRPLACRAAASLDVNACIAIFVNRQDAPNRAPLDFTTVSTKCKLALCAALKIVGRPQTYYGSTPP